RWLDVAVRPAGSNTPFASLGPRLPVAPAPQALYAYTAGSVAALGPGQAVTSLNGLTDNVVLKAGPGISLQTNGNTIIIMTSTVPGPAPAASGTATSATRTDSGSLKEREPSLQALRNEIRTLEERLRILERGKATAPAATPQ